MPVYRGQARACQSRCQCAAALPGVGLASPATRHDLTRHDLSDSGKSPTRYDLKKTPTHNDLSDSGNLKALADPAPARRPR
jgi:hypothetical protein